MSSSYEPYPPGTVLADGQYVLTRLLAVGGMGAVYKGTKQSALRMELPVAIKELLPHLSEKKPLVELFFTEAHLHAKLHHSNIVRVVDLFTDRGRFYIVLEWVEGMDLRVLIKTLIKKRFSMPLPVGLFILYELLQALHYAHHVIIPEKHVTGIVHRDLSPSNILLSRSGEVKLTDFGISHAGERLIPFKRVLGKKGYMPPELRDGGLGESRSDVYSLLVCFYELMSLFNPLLNDTENPDFNLGRTRPDIPKSILFIVQEGLLPAVHDRPSSTEMLSMLEQAVARESIPIGSTLLSDFINKVMDH